MQKSCKNLLRKPSYNPFCPKFRCHGNQGGSGVKLNDTVRFAVPENHTLEPKITTLSYWIVWFALLFIDVDLSAGWYLPWVTPFISQCFVHGHRKYSVAYWFGVVVCLCAALKGQLLLARKGTVRSATWGICNLHTFTCYHWILGKKIKRFDWLSKTRLRRMCCAALTLLASLAFVEGHATQQLACLSIRLVLYIISFTDSWTDRRVALI